LNTIWKLRRLLIYFFKRKGPHGIHSPYVYKLVSVDFRRQPNSTQIQKIATFLPHLKISTIKKISQLIGDEENLQLSETKLFIQISESLKVFFSPQHFYDFQISQMELDDEFRCVILGIIDDKWNFNNWKELQENSKFHCTLDCGSFGILVKRTHQHKEHFTI
jgi:hypothetical protein